jgi:flagellar biosynthesis/type III secretory pathway M-ring protein FliF/YscJ
MRYNVRAVLLLLVLAGIPLIPGCRKQKSDPKPNEPIKMAVEALQVIIDYLNGLPEKPPEIVRNAQGRLETHLNTALEANDALLQVQRERDRAYEKQIEQLKQTVLERNAMAVLLIISIAGVITGVWLLFNDRVKLATSNIAAGLAGIATVRFAQATGPMAMIIGVGMGVLVVILMGFGVWYLVREMRKKIERDTLLVEKGEQNRMMVLDGQEPLRSLREIARELPESTPGVKEMTRRVKRRLGIPDTTTENE